MPAVHFRLRWPDGGLETCYSPSTIVKEYFEVGRAYTMAEFLDVSRRALHAASERVRIVHGGSGCSLAMGQLAAIEAKSKSQPSDPDVVRIEAFT